MYDVTRELILAVLARAKIVDLVSEQTDLTAEGKKYLAPCPFHIQDGQTFLVDPDSGSYMCHSCGIGGDVISFVQHVHGLGVLDAVRYIAEKYQIAPESL